METDLSPVTATPAGVSDESLVARLCQGEEQAGEELARRHSKALVRYLRRLTSSDHAAEELHQQTWSSVLEHLDRFDSSLCPGGFKAWLYRIATNKANDQWRWRGREKAARAGLRLVSDDAAPDASHRMDQAEQCQKLRAAIEKLPENQKQVLLLRYYSNLKFAQIAEMLGCPLNTALGRMHKAMLRLKQLMSD
jgi:RNA polymerase sigma-70 factor (ECF subfamily)